MNKLFMVTRVSNSKLYIFELYGRMMWGTIDGVQLLYVMHVKSICLQLCIVEYMFEERLGWDFR